MVPLPVHLEHGDIEIKAGQFLAERFALGSDKAPMQLLFKGVEILSTGACASRR